MKKFSLVSTADLSKISAANLRPLTPARQIQAIRTWADQNIKKYGPMGTSDTDEEMQQFITEAAKYLGLWRDAPLYKHEFSSALAQQRGWGNEWKSKVFTTTGTPVDFDTNPLLNDTTLTAAIKKIVEDRGANHHGNTQLAGSHGQCLHWPSGAKRIFGTINPNGTMTLVGIGIHAGTNSSYKVYLLAGGSTTAVTA